jgi:hypothetical protein
MPVNSNKPEQWKTDIAKSVDLFNKWFMQFAPKAFRETRTQTTERVLAALKSTQNLTNITPSTLQQTPSVLSMLRMTTAPPIARDRLIGLAGVPPNLVKIMELEEKIPPRMSRDKIEAELRKIIQIINRLADKDVFAWLDLGKNPNQAELQRAATIVADRLCGAVADPIIRNAQEKRQLASIRKWLGQRGYKLIEAGKKLDFRQMSKGTFAFRLNVAVHQASRSKTVSIPIDAVIMPLNARAGDFPILIEAKSAGDFTNTNKRRKEEATKVAQLRKTYGDNLIFILFLCGYFDSGYLGYEAAEGIDWVWEHRIDDLQKLGI